MTNVEVIVDKDRYIYDKEMPGIAGEIQDVRMGDRVRGMVVEAKRWGLRVTLENSKIAGCRQEPLKIEDDDPTLKRREARVFYKLGLVA